MGCLWSLTIHVMNLYVLLGTLLIQHLGYIHVYTCSFILFLKKIHKTIKIKPVNIKHSFERDLKKREIYNHQK